MKRKRHTPEQIIRKLREADGLLAITATILSIVILTGRLLQMAGRFDGQAKLWTRLMLAWDGLAQRTESDHPPKPHELQAAERKFLHLFEQEPRVPWPFVQKDVLRAGRAGAGLRVSGTHFLVRRLFGFAHPARQGDSSNRKPAVPPREHMRADCAKPSPPYPPRESPLTPQTVSIPAQSHAQHPHAD